MSELSKYLKALRAERGVSLRDIEYVTKIPNSYLSQLENGNKRYLPIPKYLNELADYFGVTVELLLKKAGYLIGTKNKLKSDQKLRILQVNLKNLHNKVISLEKELSYLLVNFDD